MLNSNFDLRKFLTESKKQMLSESSRDQFIVVSAQDFMKAKERFEEVLDTTVITPTATFVGDDKKEVRVDLKFRPTEEWEAFESPTETMYDIIEDLESMGVTILTSSLDVSALFEGAKFKVGDMVKLSGGEPTEVLAVRKMTGSDLHAYSIKNSKGERAEYDETQLSAANVDEVLSEATVMEYIRERMDRMNDDVRECMKEYIQACNEIDPGHEDAHAQLMSALEDFYNKLKAHFEQDEAEMEEPLATNDEVPHIDLEEGPVYPEDKHTMTPDEFEDDAFGGEEDEINEDYEPRTKEDLVFQYLRDAWQFGAIKGKDVNPDEELSTMTDSLLANLPDYDAAERVDEESGNSVFSKKSNHDYAELHDEGNIGDYLYKVLERAYNLGQESDWQHKPAEELTSMADEITSKLEINKSDELSEEVVSEGLDPETVKLLLGMAKLAVTAGTVPAALGILYQYKDNPKIAKAIEAFERHLDK